MPDFTMASAICRIKSSLTLQANLFQLFHPMGGVGAKAASCANNIEAGANKTMAKSVSVLALTSFMFFCVPSLFCGSRAAKCRRLSLWPLEQLLPRRALDRSRHHYRFRSSKRVIHDIEVAEGRKDESVVNPHAIRQGTLQHRNNGAPNDRHNQQARAISGQRAQFSNPQGENAGEHYRVEKADKKNAPHGHMA